MLIGERIMHNIQIFIDILAQNYFMNSNNLKLVLVQINFI